VSFAVSLLVSWAWSLNRLLRSETRLIQQLGARMPKAGTLLQTKSVLRDMAIAGGLERTPQFYVIDTPTVNAFVLGRSLDCVRIGVTRGMLERIPVDEQRAVFANLIARVISLDTRWATAVSALMGPIWAMRDFDLRYEPPDPGEDKRLGSEPRRQRDDSRAGMFLFYGLAVIITEFLSWYHQEAAWRAAEKADAEGMMLLKDPRSMLSAIEHVLERNNHVPAAGDAYSQLFFCWAGFGFAPEDDPEMRRVARLRETLGAEGAPYIPRPNVPGWPTAPTAPRIELAEETAADGWGADEI
jgi:Zn-dependent protease with chaperone function